MTKYFWLHLGAQVGAAVIAAGGTALAGHDYTSLGSLAGLAQGAAALAAEGALALAKKWNP